MSVRPALLAAVAAVTTFVPVAGHADQHHAVAHECHYVVQPIPNSFDAIVTLTMDAEASGHPGVIETRVYCSLVNSRGQKNEISGALISPRVHFESATVMRIGSFTKCEWARATWYFVPIGPYFDGHSVTSGAC